MAIDTFWNAALAAVATFGAGSVIVVGLARWLGEITAKRIPQAEQNIVLQRLEELKQEFGLASLSYEKHVEVVTGYSEMFYRSYRLCQDVVNWDVTKRPGCEDVNSRDKYLKEINPIVDDWNARQGVIRLVIPRRVLELHEEAIRAFGRFNTAVIDFDSFDESTRRENEAAFEEIDGIKRCLEEELRIHLRSDTVQPPTVG